MNPALVPSVPAAMWLSLDGNGHLFVTRGNQVGSSGAIGEYGLDGQVVNASLISGLNYPSGLALDRLGHFFVTAGNSILEYTTSGDFVRSAFEGNSPGGLALDGHGRLLVADWVSGVVGVYDANTLSLINPALISGLTRPSSIVLDAKGHLYVANFGTFPNGFVGEYDAVSGAAINVSLISGFSSPYGMTLDGDGHLFVASNNGGYVAEFDAVSGATINSSLISGLGSPWGIAFAVPEPSSISLIVAGAVLFCATRPRKIDHRPTGT